MHPFFKVSQESLPARIKAKILQDISGSQDRFPSDREIVKYLMKIWKTGSEYRKILFHLLFEKRATHRKIPLDFSLDAAREVLNLLFENPPIQVLLSEIQYVSETTPPKIQCCLILGHEKPDGKPEYYCAIFDEKSFPDLCCYVSLVPPGELPAGDISFATESGWQMVPLDEAIKMPEIRTILTIFKKHLIKTKVKVKLKDIKIEKEFDPPVDSECMSRLSSVLTDQMAITLAYASMEIIRPFDIPHCFKVPELSDEEIREEMPMLVYWKEDAFIMSDDFPTYVTYRKRKTPTVKIAIMGDFPKESVKIIEEGGKELLPGFHLSKDAEQIADPDYQLWKLDEHLRRKENAKIPADLLSVWLGFSDLLNSKKASERHIHNFIIKYPVVISAYGKNMESEVSLGLRYRIDLILKSTDVRDEILLIELESHLHKIFTSNGRPTYKVTHATQQVHDWLKWIRENPNEPLAKSCMGLPPKGLVVVGRSSKLTEEERTRLAHLNQDNYVKVITYDELFVRFGDLILEQCDDTST